MNSTGFLLYPVFNGFYRFLDERSLIFLLLSTSRITASGLWETAPALIMKYRFPVWMDIINHDGTRIRSGGGCVRSFDLGGPHVWFRVYTALIHQRQTRQEQDLLLLCYGTKGSDVHSDGVDAKQGALP